MKPIAITRQMPPTIHQRHELIFVLLVLSNISIDAAFYSEYYYKTPIAKSSERTQTNLFAKKQSSKHGGTSNSSPTKKKTVNKVVVSGGVKGFGTSSVVPMDRSKETRAFYEYLEANGASDTLKRTCIGNEPQPKHAAGTYQLRGVLCSRDIMKGSDIINIPSSLAINLGPEGEDPTLPAVEFLKDYCTVMMSFSSQQQQQIDNTLSSRYNYYRMLPGYRSLDCLGSTDFFSDEALDALQSPSIVEETRARRLLVLNRFAKAFGGETTNTIWIDGSPLTVDHLQWAVWLITSRVLTVQTENNNNDSSSTSACRLLIPYLDMCNHDRSSPHILTGRVGGDLKVKAGAIVKTGDPIHIAYGNGQVGNDRFLQDYGFTDPSPVAYDIVAQTLLGKRRILREGRSTKMESFLSKVDQNKSLEALQTTTIQEDEILLGKELDRTIRSAIEYRLGVKKALNRNSL